MARESPLGSLLAELRLSPRSRAAPRPPRTSGPVPDLELRPVDTRSPASLGLISISSLLHAALALGVVVVPILAGGQLPAPASGVRVFFAEPMTIAPPPPPAAAARATRPRTEPPSAPSLTVPMAVPENVVPEAADSGSASA